MDTIDSGYKTNRGTFTAGPESKDEIAFGLAGPPILDSVELDDPPDGGVQAWINVSCSCALMFTVFGFRGYRSLRRLRVGSAN